MNRHLAANLAIVAVSLAGWAIRAPGYALLDLLDALSRVQRRVLRRLGG